MARKPAHATALLFSLFFLGLLVTVFAYVDVEWTHWLFVKDRASHSGVDQQQFQKLRQSILYVHSDCPGGAGHSGTGFIVKSGFVATAAHIFGEGHPCNGPIHLIDYKGVEHAATLAGVSAEDDLALLKFTDATLPALHLANATTYETPNRIVRLVTIGYPLTNARASAPDSASISGEGTLSRFQRDSNVFVTSGLNLNPGNSGGPVFVRDDWTVLGIARSKLPNTVGDGIGFVASIRSLQTFFRATTGQELQ